MPTDSYLYLARDLSKCMMRNLRGPIRKKNMSTQSMINYKMSTQNIPYFHVCSTFDI